MNSGTVRIRIYISNYIKNEDRPETEDLFEAEKDFAAWLDGWITAKYACALEPDYVIGTYEEEAVLPAWLDFELKLAVSAWKRRTEDRVKRNRRTG